MTEEASQERLVVFEAANDTLREFYVGIFALPLTADEIASRHKDKPPAAIAHWQEGHKVWYRCVEAGLSATEGKAFLRVYAEKVARPGWTVLVD